MALRTLCEAQPNGQAIWAGRCPRALASKIWHRRRVKASAERSPAPSCWRSAGVNGRTYMGGFMPHSLPAQLLLHKIYRELALGPLNHPAFLGQPEQTGVHGSSGAIGLPALQPPMCDTLGRPLGAAGEITPAAAGDQEIE
jgi:hypothetical protein